MAYKGIWLPPRVAAVAGPVWVPLCSLTVCLFPAVTGCLFCGVRGVGVGAWPVAGQVREAGHEQPHLPVLTPARCQISLPRLPAIRLLLGLARPGGNTPMAPPLTWTHCGPGLPGHRHGSQIGGCSAHPSPTPYSGDGRGGAGLLRPGRGRGAELGPPSSPRQWMPTAGQKGGQRNGEFLCFGPGNDFHANKMQPLNEFAIRNGGCQVRAAPAVL